LEGACRAKDKAGAAEALRGFLEVQSQACQLLTVVYRKTFREVDKNTWAEEPDPLSACKHLSATHTLRRDPESPNNWNYTEVVVAKASFEAAATCAARPGTTQFDWRKAVTAYGIECRYIAM
jgi:hypothetical protein